MKYHYTGEPKPCAVCGTVFKPKSHTSRYCSHKCKYKANSKAFKAKNPEYWAAYLKKRRESTKRGIPRFDQDRPKRRCKSCKKYHRGYFEYCHDCIVRKSNYIAEGCEAMI